MKTRNSHFDSVSIRSTGSYVPSKILTNDEVLANLPTTSEWVVETLGIRQRHVAEPDEYTSDLAAHAGLAAIAAAGLEPNDIELIIVSTATPDRKMPSAACLAQVKMGITNRCAAFDVAAVCAGFVYATTIAGQFIQNGTYDRVLVIGADTFSKVTDWSHRDCVVFGDAAGAVVMERKERTDGLFSSILLADGAGANHFTVYPGDDYYKMNGKEVFRAATTAVPECIQEILRINGLGLEDVSLIVPHQATLGVLKRIAKTLCIPFSRIQTNLESYANTAGATVPLLLDQVNQRGLLHPGDLLLMVSIGAGWTWGASLYRW